MLVTLMPYFETNAADDFSSRRESPRKNFLIQPEFQDRTTRLHTTRVDLPCARKFHLHVLVIRSPAALRWNPGDVAVWIFDVAGFAVDTVLRVDHVAS